MFTQFLAVLTSVLNINNVFITPENLALDPAPETRFTFQCSEPAWVGTPGLRGGVFEGTLNATCDVVLQSVGSFTHLQNNLTSRIGGPQVKINAGPIAETYKNMPSQYYDVTLSAEEQGDRVTLDQDIHIATNARDLLLFDTVSRKIIGSGMGKYLLNADAYAQITTAIPVDPKDFKMEFTNSVRIKKPALVPGGMFIGKVKTQLMQVAKEQLPKLIPPLAEGLMQ